MGIRSFLAAGASEAAGVAVALLAAAFVVPAAADPGVGPPWNIDGDWKCVRNCISIETRATRVIQNGNQFRFVNEAGLSSSGEWRHGFWIDFLGCDNIAELSPDLMTIMFGFRPVWSR